MSLARGGVTQPHAGSEASDLRLSPDWPGQITWPDHWPLIGWETGHVTWILTSGLSIMAWLTLMCYAPLWTLWLAINDNDKLYTGGEKLGADFQNHLTINFQNPIKVSPGYETEARLQMGSQFSSNEVSIFWEENHIKVTLFHTVWVISHSNIVILVSINHCIWSSDCQDKDITIWYTGWKLKTHRSL